MQALNHAFIHRHYRLSVVIKVLISEAYSKVLERDDTQKALAPVSPNELLLHYDFFALLNASKSLSVIICSRIILIYDSDYHKLLVRIDLCIHF